jgi:hypothetical protein
LPYAPPAPYRPLFAKGYNDLILRPYEELPAWLNYLHDNPRRLMMKRAHPDLLRPFFNLQLGSQTYNGIGNRQLLSAPRRIAVRLSRRLSEKEIEEIMVEIDEEIGIKLKAGIGRGKNAEDAAYMADIGLEEIRANNNGMWTWVIEKEY